MQYDLVMVDKYSVTYPRAYRALENRLSFTGSGGPYVVDGLGASDAFVFWKTEGSDEVSLGQTSVVERWGAGYRVRFGRADEQAKRQYRVTTGAGFLVPKIEPARPVTDLLAGTAAQMLIVSHPDFLAGIEPLAAARRSSGVTVKVVDLRDVYESFSGGIVDPSAIRELVKQAYQRWKTRSVLLVGGDTYDYFDYLGVGSRSFVPTLYAQTDPAIVRYAPVDPLFGDVDGDGVPEVSVGRLPARTSAELSLLVGKTLGYKGGNRVLLAADAIDPSLSFKTVSETIAAALPADTQASRAYVDDLGLQGARTTLLGTMNAGGGLVSYVGHSSPNRWSFQSLFTTTDAGGPDELDEPARGDAARLLEQLLRRAGLQHSRTHPDGERRAGGRRRPRHLHPQRRLLRRPPRPGARPAPAREGQDLGAALLDAKTQLATDGHNRPDIQLGMTLLGDPEVVINP